MSSTASSLPLPKPMPSCWSSAPVITPEWPRCCWGLSPAVCCITPPARWRLSRPRPRCEEEGSEMSTWNRTGPVVVEVDGNADLRVVDYAVEVALSAGADLALVAPYSVRGSFTPMMPGYSPKSPAELADASLRAAVAHIRHRYGYGVQLSAVTCEGSRSRVLAHAAKDARMLVIARSRSRGPQRLMNTHVSL